MICPYCKNKLEKIGLNRCPSCGGALTRNADLNKDKQICPSVKVFSLLCFFLGLASVITLDYIYAIASLVMYALYNKTTLVYDPKVKAGRILSIVSIAANIVIFISFYISLIVAMFKIIVPLMA